MITTKNKGTQTAVYTPYNAAFVSAIRKIGGAKWDAGSKAWMVPTASLPQVRAIMRDVFGEDDQLDTCKRVTVRLSFAKNCYSADRKPLEILGKTVARAYGRDSGAKPGDDVAFEAGSLRSDGSRANWYSVVEEGSVAILRNVPETMLDKAELPEGVTMEVIRDSGIDRAALTEEKEKLLARLAEIENLLNA